MDESYKLSFAITFKRLMAAFGKTLAEVAEIADLDPTYLRRLLNGEKLNPSAEVLDRLWMAIIFDREAFRKNKTLPQEYGNFLTSALMTMATSKALAERLQFAEKELRKQKDR